MIVVTGPDGFVGTEVCRELVRRGSRVCGAQWRAVPLPDGCRSIVVGDIGPATAWGEALAGAEAVIHLAAQVHVMRDTAADPLAEFRRVNVEGSRQLAEAAARAGVKRFIFLSSIKVNGESTARGNGPDGTGPLPGKDGAISLAETDEARPEDPYGVSKWEAEEVLREMERRSGMAVTVIRPPLIYGPGVKATFLQLFQLVDRGLPLPLGGIRNQRSFLGRTNLVDLICCCLVNPAAGGETFLASDGEDVSTPELVRRIARALEKPARLLAVPEWLMRLGGVMTGRSMQIKRLCGSLRIDSSKVRRVLGWTPPCTMAEELARTAQWYRAGRKG